MIKFTSRAALMAALAAALFGPAFADDAYNATSGSEHKHTRLDRPAPANMPSDAQIVGMLETVDQVETEAAQAALERSKNEEVLAFARQMIVDHGEASRNLNTAGIKSANSEFSRRIKDHSRTTSRRLNKLEGAAFDRAYINAMVEDHTMVLEKIDEKMLPSAKSDDLAKNLRDRRPVIESHLEHARRIKDSFGR